LKGVGASFPASSARAGLPDSYAGVLAEIKQINHDAYQ